MELILPLSFSQDYVWWCQAVCKWQEPSPELNDMFTKVSGISIDFMSFSSDPLYSFSPLDPARHDADDGRASLGDGKAQLPTTTPGSLGGKIWRLETSLSLFIGIGRYSRTSIQLVALCCDSLFRSGGKCSSNNLYRNHRVQPLYQYFNRTTSQRTLLRRY